MTEHEQGQSPVWTNEQIDEYIHDIRGQRQFAITPHGLARGSSYAVRDAWQADSDAWQAKMDAANARIAELEAAQINSIEMAGAIVYDALCGDEGSEGDDGN